MRGLQWRRQGVAALVSGACLMIGAVSAEAAAPAEDWQYGVMIYGWLPSVGGDLKYGLPPGSGSDSVSVDASKILDALQMTFMVSAEARKGNWSAFTDVIYLKLSGDKDRSVTVPSGTTDTLFDADLDLKSWVWTLAGGYTVWRDRESHLDLIAGARLLSLETDLKLTGGGPLQQDRKLSDSVDLWDGIVGAAGRIALNEHWFVPYYADVGTGDTDLTWQVAGGVGYAFDWGDVMLMYRYLDYDQGDDKLLQDVSFGGGMLGVNFRF